ncbi:EF-hand calcium-binding domain-containing protein 3 [Struthio camelus]|uniref:EF-hand calcium-binding domain-containing protein 3 n=1 Tax=Struthio camelus TaxID=8801 RepID=UPI003603B537
MKSLTSTRRLSETARDEVDIQNLDSILGTRGAPLTSKNLQEAFGHTTEDSVAVDNLGSVLATMGIRLTPEQLQEVLSRADGDKVSIQDLDSILGTMGIHLTSEELQEALGHTAGRAHGKVNLSEFMKAEKTVQKPPLGKEDKVDVSNVGSILATMGIHLTPEELQEAWKHVPVDEGGDVSLSAYLSMMNTRRPSQAERNRVDIRSLDTILGSVGIHLTNEEMQEVLEHVTVDSDGKVNLSEFMHQVKAIQSTAQGAEKAAPAPGHVPKPSMLNSLPKKMVLKSLPGKTTRERSHIPQKRSKCKAAKNLTKKQLEAFRNAFNFFPKDPDGTINLHSLQETAKELGISLTSQEASNELVYADADRDGKVNFSDFLTIVTDNKCFMQAIVPEKNYTGNFDSKDARRILLFEILSKLVELAALPRRTLLEIVRYYQQKFMNCTGQKAWKDSDNSMYCKKRHHKIRKDQAYVSSFVSAARISVMNDKDLVAYVEGLKACVPLSDSPYAEVPIFPLIPKQDTIIAGRPKKDLQKLERQRRNEPIASSENFFHKRNWLQEATAFKLPADFRKQRSSPRVNPELLNKPCHLTADKLGKMQLDMKRATQLYRQGLALHERARLLRLWRRIRGGQIALETGSERFHHIFSVYSWSWNTCQELVTPDDLRRVDNELYRRPRGSSTRASRAAARGQGSNDTSGTAAAGRVHAARGRPALSEPAVRHGK